MKKEEIEVLVKEFCEAENVHNWQGVDRVDVHKGYPVVLSNFMAKFLASMIEKGEVVNANLKLTVSNAGKEVSANDQNESLANEYLKDFDWDDDHAKQCAKAAYVDALEYSKQLKSSPCSTANPAQLISDEDSKIAMNAAYKGDGHNAYYANGWYSAIKWYREQLTNKA